MADKVLILGKGFVGTRLQQELNCERSEEKLYTFKDADREISRFAPKTIINCIGYIGRNVDDCESDIDKTLMSNAFIPMILAEVAIRRNIRLIHISSGCIYHYDYAKDQPIPEDKIPDFFDLFYSRAKIYSEQALGNLSRKYPILIARVRVPLDNRPHARNILDKLVQYKKVIDVPNSITYIPDFIKALKHLIQVGAKGIYNTVNEGGLRYQDLMEVYKKYVPDFKYEVIDYKKLNLIRTNLILSTKKLEDSGFKVRSIQEVLEECVKDYLKY